MGAHGGEEPGPGLERVVRNTTRPRGISPRRGKSHHLHLHLKGSQQSQGSTVSASSRLGRISGVFMDHSRSRRGASEMGGAVRAKHHFYTPPRHIRWLTGVEEVARHEVAAVWVSPPIWCGGPAVRGTPTDRRSEKQSRGSDGRSPQRGFDFPGGGERAEGKKIRGFKIKICQPGK